MSADYLLEETWYCLLVEWNLISQKSKKQNVVVKFDVEDIIHFSNGHIYNRNISNIWPHLTQTITKKVWI